MAPGWEGSRSGAVWGTHVMCSGSDEILGGGSSTQGLVFTESRSGGKADRPGFKSWFGFMIYKLCVLATSFVLSELQLPYL